jgi:hypothetical protein
MLDRRTQNIFDMENWKKITIQEKEEKKNREGEREREREEIPSVA